jgi:hypothetical protein
LCFWHPLLPQDGAASGKTGDYAKLISLLRSRADRRGECSVMTIPIPLWSNEQCGGRNSDSIRRSQARAASPRNIGSGTSKDSKLKIGR